MYSTEVSEKRLACMIDAIRVADPSFDPKPTPQADALAKSAQLESLMGEDGALHRPLTTEEERWVLGELTLSKASFE